MPCNTLLEGEADSIFGLSRVSRCQSSEWKSLDKTRVWDHQLGIAMEKDEMGTKNWMKKRRGTVDHVPLERLKETNPRTGRRGMAREC